VEAAARLQPSAASPVYARRQPEKTAPYQVLQRHLLTFEQQWTDETNGRTLPKFVTDELHAYLSCGILGPLAPECSLRCKAWHPRAYPAALLAKLPPS
jgi:hypothetical protein